MSKDACRAHQSVAGEAFGNGARVGGLAVVARNGLEQIFFPTFERKCFISTHICRWLLIKVAKYQFINIRSQRVNTTKYYDWMFAIHATIFNQSNVFLNFVTIL